MNKLFFVACLLILLSACNKTVNQGQFTVISNKNIDLTNIDTSFKNRKQNIKGESDSFRGFFSSNYPSFEEALDNAFSHTNGDVLLDVKVEKFFRNDFMRPNRGWVVRGDSIKTIKNF